VSNVFAILLMHVQEEFGPPGPGGAAGDPRRPRRPDAHYLKSPV